MALDTGIKLGRYEIRSQIGEGGMGEVYLAEDVQLHRKVALKVLQVISDRIKIECGDSSRKLPLLPLSIIRTSRTFMRSARAPPQTSSRWSYRRYHVAREDPSRAN